MRRIESIASDPFSTTNAELLDSKPEPLDEGVIGPVEYIYKNPASLDDVDNILVENSANASFE